MCAHECNGTLVKLESTVSNDNVVNSKYSNLLINPLFIKSPCSITCLVVAFIYVLSHLYLFLALFLCEVTVS